LVKTPFEKTVRADVFYRKHFPYKQVSFAPVVASAAECMTSGDWLYLVFPGRGVNAGVV
jgi:hypothetical protein